MSAVTREQILRECGKDETASSMPVSRMPPGTLALYRSPSSTDMMLVTRDGNWAVLTDTVIPPSNSFGTGYSSTLGIPLFVDIPIDAWSRICAEPSQIERVRIALTVVGLNGSDDESNNEDALIAAAGGMWASELVAIGSTAAGTLLVNGTRLALMQNDGCWAWLIPGIITLASDFNAAGSYLEARVLITGIPDTVWSELRGTSSNRERVKIAAAAAAARLKLPPTVTVTNELPGVTQELLEELSVGLFDPRELTWGPRVGTAKMWLALQPDELRQRLHSVGIEWDNYSRASEARVDRVHAKAVLPGCTGDRSIYTAGRGYASPREVAYALLNATPLRREHAHAYLHRGVLARLRTWSRPPRLGDGGRWVDQAVLRASLIDTHDGTWSVFPGGPLGRVPRHPGIRISCKSPDTSNHKPDAVEIFGRTLRQVTKGLWDEFRAYHPNAPVGPPPDWLAEDAVTEVTSFADGTSRTELRRDLAELQGVDPNMIYLRHVATAAGVSAQAPVSLKTLALRPGSSLIIETIHSLNSKQQRESLAAWLLRKTRVDHVHLTEMWCQGWTSLSMPKSQAERKTT